MSRLEMRTSHLPDLMEPIPIIIIGAGKMGKAHLEVIQQLPHFEVVGVASRTGESAHNLAEYFGIPNSSDDWKVLVEESDAKACVICVSHLLNEEITREAIGMGLHVLAEKPVSLSSKRIRELIPLVLDKKVKVLVALNRRYYSNILQAIDTLEFYGGIKGITIVAPDPVVPYRSMGTYDPLVYDEWTKMNTIHAVDMMLLIGGEVSDFITRKIVPPDCNEKSLVALLQFKSGILGTFIAHSSYGGMKDWEIKLAGLGIQAQIQPFEKTWITVDGSKSYVLKPAQSIGGHKPGLREQAIAFWEAIVSDHISWPSCDLQQHARAIEIIEAMENTLEK